MVKVLEGRSIKIIMGILSNVIIYPNVLYNLPRLTISHNIGPEETEHTQASKLAV